MKASARLELQRPSKNCKNRSAPLHQRLCFQAVPDPCDHGHVNTPFFASSALGPDQAPLLSIRKRTCACGSARKSDSWVHMPKTVGSHCGAARLQKKGPLYAHLPRGSRLALCKTKERKRERERENKTRGAPPHLTSQDKNTAECSHVWGSSGLGPQHLMGSLCWARTLKMEPENGAETILPDYLCAVSARKRPPLFRVF